VYVFFIGTIMRKFLTLFIALLLTACGGSPNSVVTALQAEIVSAGQPPAGVSVSVDDVFDWAEKKYSKYFPSHQTTHTARADAKRKPNRKHYANDYAKRAKQVRDTAQICWLCNQGYKPNDPWTADHIYPAEPDSLLLAAHRSCNSSRGNKS
jgi:hypothetical protein